MSFDSVFGAERGDAKASKGLYSRDGKQIHDEVKQLVLDFEIGDRIQVWNKFARVPNFREHPAALSFFDYAIEKWAGELCKGSESMRDVFHHLHLRTRHASRLIKFDNIIHITLPRECDKPESFVKTYCDDFVSLTQIYLVPRGDYKHASDEELCLSCMSALSDDDIQAAQELIEDADYHVFTDDKNQEELRKRLVIELAVSAEKMFSDDVTADVLALAEFKAIAKAAPYVLALRVKDDAANLYKEMFFDELEFARVLAVLNAYVTFRRGTVSDNLPWEMFDNIIFEQDFQKLYGRAIHCDGDGCYCMTRFLDLLVARLEERIQKGTRGPFESTLRK